MLLLSDDCKKQQVTNSLAEFKKKKKRKAMWFQKIGIVLPMKREKKYHIFKRSRDEN